MQLRRQHSQASVVVDSLGSGADTDEDSEFSDSGVENFLFSDSEGSEDGDINEEYDEHRVSDSEPSDVSESEDDVDSDVSDGASEDGFQQATCEGDQPIYEGAPITLHESLLSIFCLASSEHVSGKMLGRILELVALHCPQNSLCKRTLHLLKKYFSSLGLSKLEYHYFCDNCVYPLKTKDSVCRKCKKSGDYSFFIDIPMFPQLQSMYKRPRFYTDLQHRFDPNRKKNPSNIEDVIDGRIYQEQVKSGFLSVPSNISFQLWADGMKVFRSAVKSSIWPLGLSINELSYKKRILPRNIVLAGLWFGKKPPNPNLFLKPLCKSMKVMSTTGYNFKLHDNSEINVKAKILCATFDLPARAKFMSFKQFNGEEGCSRCLDVGERVALEKGSVQSYPYSRNMVLRTDDQTKEFAEQALNLRRAGVKKVAVHGVKGPSLLSCLLPNFIRCVAIDVMHGAFLGLCKLLLILWLDPRFSHCPWSLADSLDLLDSRIQQLKPPSFVQRPLRSIKHALSFWKASEFKLFLLYYSVPILMGIMDDKYFNHHCKLVSALSLLCQDSISVEQIEASSKLLHEYVASFAQMYGKRFLGYNVHQLLHLPDCVADLGPAWVYSCFFWESLNGILGKLFHGTRHVATQICSSVKLFMEMPIMIESLPDNSIVKRFCKNVTYKRHPCKIADQISENLDAVGTYSNKRDVVESSKILLQNIIGLNAGGSVQIFYRLKKDGIMYFCHEYKRSSSGKKDSSFVAFNINNAPHVGRVLRYVKWKNCTPLCPTKCKGNCPCSFFCIVREYSRQLWYPHDHPQIRFPHISKVKISNNVVAVPVESLICLLFYAKVDDDEYLSQPLNSVEVE